MATIHEWRSNPTHAIDYILLSSEERHRISPQQCHLLEAFANDDGDMLFGVTCFACSGCLSLDDYYRCCRQLLISNLRSRFPFVRRCCAARVADSFMPIIECAHACHRCPRLHHRVPFPTTHLVQIQVDAAIDQSFQEAAAGARLRPAAKDAVKELLRAREDRDQLESLGECVICFEEMETRKSALTMPCSHSFHQTCLLQWLHANHVCPLCRYELPVATQD